MVSIMIGLHVCTTTQGIDGRRDEQRIAQWIQKMVKESMLSDSSSFDRA